MIIRAEAVQSAKHSVLVRLRCPVCRQVALLEPLGTDAIISATVERRACMRRCANPECLALIFVVLENYRVRLSYPGERIDFDSTNIPPGILAALEEAITCHASGCFVAAAIMVRKTLEELCADRGAQGPNLKARIQSLSTSAVLPKELLDGLDELRLLGNDAAHLESQTYNQIGANELEVAVEFTKEVLKAVYQYSALLERLQALKKSSPMRPGT